ncbi:MAG: SpoIIE family protein phosphatase [Spirochaetaceae bacterium]|nr:SpoIIE family protein phosphatase [Spirochaetaceae bacterium]
MDSVSIAQALSGPLLVKLVLAPVLGAVFLYLRRRETEGLMTGYVFVTLFLAFRDILFAFLPIPDLYRISDLLLFGFLCRVATSSFSRGPGLWAVLAVDFFAALLLGLKALFGFAPGLPSEVLRFVAVVPVVAAAVLPSIRKDETETPSRVLALGFRIPFTVGSIAYLVVGAFLGADSPIFHYAAVPLFYGLILAIGFVFMSILLKELVQAVGYYEESIDSLYELLLSAGTAVKAEFSIQEVLDSMAAVFTEKAGADGGAILLTEEFEEAVSVRAVHGSFPPPFKLPESLPRAEERVVDFVRHARFKLGEGLLGEVAQTGKQLFIADAALDPRVARNGEEPWLRLTSFIAAPLIVRDRIIGALALSKSGGEPFDERDFDRAKLLANFGSIAVANSFSFLEAAERSDIEREAAIAEGVQKTIVPKKLADLGAFSFGVFTTPARGVCSDYYDVIQTRADRAVLAVGDVAGKGVAAGIVMAMIRSILHLITNSAKDTATLLSWVNRGISGKVDLDHFATLSLVAVDATTGEAEFANAAHQPLLIYRKDSDAIETVDIKSIPIGVERATEYSAKRLRIRPGDVLVMYTDGIVEAMNEQGRQFGRKNLGNAILRSRDLPAREIAEAIRDDVAEFSGRSRQHDDQTVLVLKAKP